MSENLTNIQIIEDMVDYVLRTNKNAKRDIVYIMVLKHFSDVVSRGRLKIERRQDKTLFSFSSMLFSRSGGGKDLTNTQVHDNFFIGATEVYKTYLKDAFKKQEEKVLLKARAKFPDEKREKVLFEMYVKNNSPRMVGVFSDTLTTPEGYVSDRMAVSKYPFGAISVISKEFGDTLESFDKTSKTLFTLMKEAWDNGSSTHKSTKGEKILKSVEGVPMTAMFYSTIGNFKKTKADVELIKLFVGGWYRRSLIAYDSASPEEPKEAVYITVDDYEKEDVFFNADTARNGEIRDIISSLQMNLLDNPNSTITYTAEAGTFFVNYQSKMNYLSQKQAVLDNNCETLRRTDYDGRAWLIFRIAGLLSAIQSKTQVELFDIENAVKIVEHYSEQALALVDTLLKPSVEQYRVGHHEKLMQIAKEKGYFNLRDVSNVLGRSSYERNKDLFLDEMHEYAFENDYCFKLEKIKREERYVLTVMPKSEDVKVGLSVCTAVRHDYIPKKDENDRVINLHEKFNMHTPFEWTLEGEETLQSALAIATSCNYSAGRFKDNYRKADNWLGGNTMLIYDVDAGTTIEETKLKLTDTSSMFLDTACAIMPTKSHQKEKNGVVCDRFRVFIPLEKPMDFDDTKRFKRIMNNVADAFKLTFDKGTIDPSRMFYPSAPEALEQAWFNPCALHFVDWKMFDHDVMGKAELNQVARFHNATYSFAGSTKERTEKGVRSLVNNIYKEGNRNITLYRCLKWLQSAEFTKSEAEGLMFELTSSSPLPLSEFEATVRSAWK